MAQKPVLRGEVGCACAAREVSVGVSREMCLNGRKKMDANGHFLSAVLQLPFKARRQAFLVLPPSGFCLGGSVPRCARPPGPPVPYNKCQPENRKALTAAALLGLLLL